jgi:mono/diheme cytochrome c family protein
MSRRAIVAVFEREEDLVAAAAAARKAGCTIEDAYSPYSVHGLPEAMGLERSWLPWACFAFGATGAAFAIWLQFWTSAVAWPTNVGGRPWNSLPAYVPVIFELMVLLAGVGVVLVLFAARGLWPGRRVAPVEAGATDDRFILVLDGAGPVDVRVVRRLLESHDATSVDERELVDPPKRPISSTRLNLGLGAAVLVAMAAYWGLGLDPLRPNVEFMPNMARAVSAEAFAASRVLPRGQTLQPPPAGSIARGMMPLHYAATPEDAVRAGVELINPFAADAAAALARGQTVYATYCQVCHGATGLGDGRVTQRGFPPPPSLLADNARKLADGQMFHILTYGQKNMPPYAAQVPREDRWMVILHVRRLQQQGAATSSPLPAPGS